MIFLKIETHLDFAFAIKVYTIHERDDKSVQRVHAVTTRNIYYKIPFLRKNQLREILYFECIIFYFVV